MKNLIKIKLDERLELCAKNVRVGKNIADVGTDHGYIAIWLVLNKISPRAIATDIRVGPLLNAQKNIKKYKVENKIETRLSNGLDKVQLNEVDDIIIAGMGGELIIEIIKSAEWLKNKSKHLILQPMSAEKELREFLFYEGFNIVSEQVVVSKNKIYTVMSVFFSDKDLVKFDILYPYIGKIQNNLSPEAFLYIKKTIRDLKNKLQGYILTKNFEKANNLKSIIFKLEKILGGKNNGQC